ncbi:MAG: Unknown protein [uncultured Campylobacterales bacterium]|uniref:Transposase IS200-like domain-containing protein n=1 Tax=uncultured Campylobacterales bacterium TaxID=352960 RepID=A0A6S6S269_9BACT|nr:MAG: Unknown protein [uncultured Campylobacterales bacterium]
MKNKYILKYSLVLVAKAKRKILSEDSVVATIEEEVYNIAKSNNVEILDFGVGADHIHLQFKATPYIRLDSFIKDLSARTNRVVKSKNKTEFKKYYKMNSIWAKNYCISSAQGIGLDVIKEHLAMEDFDK